MKVSVLEVFILMCYVQHDADMGGKEPQYKNKADGYGYYMFHNLFPKIENTKKDYNYHCLL